MSQPLTVLIPCKNERMNIRACIESARSIAQELLIADSGSTDGTLEIVEQLGGCRVIQREYVRCGEFKNWAIPQARHEWVFVLEADERVTPALANEIRQLLDQPPARDAYRVRRDAYFLGHRIRFSGWQRDHCIRLMRREGCRYVGETDHAEVAVASERVGQLRARLEHFTYRSYEQYLAKFDRYTNLQSQVWRASGRRPSPWRLLLNGPLRFLRSYVLDLGFLDGAAGLQVCALTGFYSFMKQARLWEQYHAIHDRAVDVETDSTLATGGGV